MINFSAIEDIYLQEGTVDFRRSINWFAEYIQENTDVSPISGAMFIFCNRHWNKLKILVWDKNGFWLMYKRLEKDKYDWVKKGTELRKITQKQLDWLMDGLPIEPKNLHQEYKFNQV